MHSHYTDDRRYIYDNGQTLQCNCNDQLKMHVMSKQHVLPGVDIVQRPIAK